MLRLPRRNCLPNSEGLRRNRSSNAWKVGGKEWTGVSDSRDITFKRFDDMCVTKVLWNQSRYFFNTPHMEVKYKIIKFAVFASEKSKLFWRRLKHQFSIQVAKQDLFIRCCAVRGLIPVCPAMINARINWEFSIFRSTEAKSPKTLYKKSPGYSIFHQQPHWRALCTGLLLGKR